MDTIALSKEEVFQLAVAIESAGDVKCSIAFGYALTRTRKALKDEIDTIREMQRAFEQRRRDLNDSFAVKDAEGKPVTYDEGRRVQIDPARRREHLEALEALNAEMQALLTAPIDVKVHRVAWSEAPELTVAQIGGLYPIFTGEPSANGKPKA